VKTGKLGGYEKTEEYDWLVGNAYKYGFVLSYTEDNPYYQYEPWHWRFVGKKLAKKLHKDKKYFYEMSQRDINEYLEYFYD
jgi:D-alanyl-D-alanine carboxypeptidase